MLEMKHRLFGMRRIDWYLIRLANLVFNALMTDILLYCSCAIVRPESPYRRERVVCRSFGLQYCVVRKAIGKALFVK